MNRALAVSGRMAWVLSGVSFGMLLAILWGFWWFSPQRQLQQMVELSQQGQYLQVRQQTEALLKNGQASGPVHILLAEACLYDDDLQSAEKHLAQGLQLTQQALHQGKVQFKPWLGRAMYLKVLLSVRHLLYHTEPEGVFDWLLSSLNQVRDEIQTAHAMNPEHSRWKAAQALLDTLDSYQGKKTSDNLSWWVSWQRFSEKEPLYQRLRRIPEPTPSPLPKPSDQGPVRRAIQQWQSIKRQAFLDQDISELKDILTGEALEESIMAVNWWHNHPSAYYHDIILHELRFERVTYTSAQQAVAEVRIDETHHHSEGRAKRSQYRARYHLRRLADDWLISDIEILKL